MSKKNLPLFCVGETVKGFGRGSKDLGCPTANFPLEVVQKLPKDIDAGVYFGWANVNNGDVHKAVLSIGWNPFYDNKEKSMETHIIHKFHKDFYGEMLKVCVCGYLRPEKNFNSLDDLIQAIQKDIKDAETQLDLPEFTKYRDNEFFRIDSNHNLENKNGKT